jgi:PAS domain-containing protein
MSELIDVESLRALLDGLQGEIVIADENIDIVYMNEAAIRHHEKDGGAALIGRGLLDCHNPESRHKISEMYEAFANGDLQTRQYLIPKDGYARRVIIMPIVQDGQVKGCLELIIEEPLRLPTAL